MLSQGFASTEREMCSVLSILLEAAGYSYLFVAQSPLERWRSRMVRLQHPEVQDQPE
jgi:hypothetical protein